MLAKKLWKIEIELKLKSRVCLKYLVYDCLYKLFYAPNLPQVLSNLINLKILVTNFGS